MKRHGYLIALLLVAVVITGCTVSVSNYGSVEGYVYIPEGYAMEAASVDMEPLFSDQAAAPYGYEPAEGVKIIVGKRLGTTRSDGYFRLTSIPAGYYDLTASGGPLRFPIERHIIVRVGEVTKMVPLYGGIGYYVVIGVDQYLDDDAPLSGPWDDARDVFDTFVHGNKLATVGRLLILDGGTRTKPPTRSNIKSAINEAVALADSADDYLVIYFSGKSGQDFLRPSDSLAEGWNQITDMELESWVSPFPGHVTLIVDGSESESMADGIPLEPLALRKTRYTVLAGAKTGQDAWHDSDLGRNSVFTHFLLDGIDTRAADSDPRDRNITARELWLYTDEEMEAYDQTHEDPIQVPHLHPGVYGDTVIFRY